jgi:hypothetical protein
MKFHADLFDREVRFRLGEDLGPRAKRLRLAKESMEVEHHHLASGMANKDLSFAEFVKRFNKMTHKFQDDIANAITKTQYKKLFDLDRDQRVVLADPDIIKALYGDRTVKEVYGKL